MPTIDLRGLPDDEKKKIKHIEVLLEKMHEYVQRYTDVVAALSYTHVTPFEGDYALLRERLDNMVCRDGCIALNSLGLAIKAVVRTIHQCATFKKHVDLEAINRLNGMFERRFQDAYPLRTAIAHDEDFANDPDVFESHASLDGYESANLSVEPGKRLHLGRVDKLLYRHPMDPSNRSRAFFPQGCRTQRSRLRSTE